MRHFLFASFILIVMTGCQTRAYNSADTAQNDEIEEDNGLTFSIPQAKLLVECSSFTTEKGIEFKEGRLQIFYSSARSEMQSKQWTKSLKRPVKVGYLAFKGEVGFDAANSTPSNPSFDLFEISWSLGQPPLFSGVKSGNSGVEFKMFNRGCENGKSCDNMIVATSDDNETKRIENVQTLVIGEEAVSFVTTRTNRVGEKRYRFSGCQRQKAVLGELVREYYTE